MSTIPLFSSQYGPVIDAFGGPKTYGGITDYSGQNYPATTINTGQGQPTYNDTSNYTTDTGSTGTYSAPTAPAVNPNQSYIDLINAALGRLPGQEAQAEKNAQTGFNTNLNQLNSDRAQTDQSYNTSTGQNTSQFVTNKNQINDQASSGLRSLLSVLGQHGAGGGSAARYAAPNTVAQISGQQRAGAGQNFGQNQQNLDTNYNNYLTGFENSKKQLNDWLGQQIQGAQTSSEGTRQQLLQQLVGLQPSVAAAQPYVDQINASADKVDQLGNFNPQYNGTRPTYTPQPVQSYTVKQAGAPVLGSQGNNTGAGTSALNFLLGLNKDRNLLQPGF